MGAVIRAGSGNFLELYDFLVYAYFANYIALAFFPSGDELTRLMIALGTYGVASLARPRWPGDGWAPNGAPERHGDALLSPNR